MIISCPISAHCTVAALTNPTGESFRRLVDFYLLNCSSEKVCQKVTFYSSHKIQRSLTQNTKKTRSASTWKSSRHNSAERAHYPYYSPTTAKSIFSFPQSVSFHIWSLYMVASFTDKHKSSCEMSQCLANEEFPYTPTPHTRQGLEVCCHWG